MLQRLAKESESQLPAQELLFEACRELNYDKAVIAIKNGANVNAMAPYSKDDTVIYSKENLKFSPLSLVAMHGKTKLFTAPITDEKACKIASLLLEYGANVDVLDVGDMGNSPLHWAIVTFKNKLCELFIQHAIVNQKNVINLHNQPVKEYYGSNPPLILALKAFSQYLVHNCKGLEIAELLIAAGADVNLTDHNQQSTLHWAAILRVPVEFFNLLLEKQANYHTNRFGKTPKALYETELTSEKIDICKHTTSFTELGFHIIDWDEHPMMRDINHGKALENRNKNIQPEIIETLNIFDMSLASENVARLHNEKINERDHMGRTRLHNAVFYGKIEEVSQLLKIGCDFNIRDEAGLTALELAQKLQKQFTYPVSPTFFSGKETSIQAANCATWKKIEEMVCEHINLNQRNTLII